MDGAGEVQPIGVCCATRREGILRPVLISARQRRLVVDLFQSIRPADARAEEHHPENARPPVLESLGRAAFLATVEQARKRIRAIERSCGKSCAMTIGSSAGHVDATRTFRHVRDGAASKRALFAVAARRRPPRRAGPGLASHKREPVRKDEVVVEAIA